MFSFTIDRSCKAAIFSLLKQYASSLAIPYIFPLIFLNLLFWLIFSLLLPLKLMNHVSFLSFQYTLLLLFSLTSLILGGMMWSCQCEFWDDLSIFSFSYYMLFIHMQLFGLCHLFTINQIAKLFYVLENHS